MPFDGSNSPRCAFARENRTRLMMDHLAGFFRLKRFPIEHPEDDEEICRQCKKEHIVEASRNGSFASTRSDGTKRLLAKPGEEEDLREAAGPYVGSSQNQRLTECILFPAGEYTSSDEEILNRSVGIHFPRCNNGQTHRRSLLRHYENSFKHKSMFFRMNLIYVFEKEL